MEFRLASAADARSVAALYARNQKEAYRGLLADAYLDALDEKGATEKWSAFSENAENRVFLAEDRGALLGFAACKKDEAIENCLYLESLHVALDARGGGIGRALIARCAAYARERGCDKMSVCIVRGNDRARALYVTLGARHFSYFTDDFGGTPSQSEKLLWDNVSSL